MKFKLLLLLLLAPVISFASNSPNPNVFLGTYKCTGTDPYLNKKYSGTVVVHQQHTVYRLEMNYDTGEHYLGTGGQYDPTLMSVVFQDTQNPKRIGLEQYTFIDKEKTRMQGYWVYLGDDKLGVEVCKKVPDKSN